MTFDPAEYAAKLRKMHGERLVDQLEAIRAEILRRLGFFIGQSVACNPEVVAGLIPRPKVDREKLAAILYDQYRRVSSGNDADIQRLMAASQAEAIADLIESGQVPLREEPHAATDRS